jgi:hypothetical protein
MEMEYIKTNFIPYIRENSERARQIRLAEEYRCSVAERKVKAKKHTRETVMCIAILVCFLAIVIGVLIKAFTAPNAYYKKTETMQPDGNYFVWVTERICEVEKIDNDLVTVEYKGNLYDFFVSDPETYEIGQKIVCQFTNDMEIVGVE